MKFLSPFSSRGLSWFLRAGITLVGFCMPATVGSQTFLGLDEAMALALRNNYSIRVARNDSVIAGREVTYGNAGMLPTLTVTGSWDKALLGARVRTVAGGEIDRKSASASLIAAGLQANWTLFDGTRMFVQYDKLKSLATLSSLDLKTEMENTLSAITGAYCDLVRQKQMLGAFRQKLAVSDLRLSVARNKFRTGAGSEQEMLQAEVIRLADTTAVTRQWTALKKAGIRLNQLMAADLQQEYATEDTISLLLLPAPEQLIDLSLRNNGTYLQAGVTQQISRLEIKLLRSQQLPRLSVRASYGYNENETSAAFINYNRTFGPQAGLTATLPVFDGMNLHRRITRAELEMENQGLRLKELEQELIALILDGWYEHQNLLQMVALGRERIRVAEKNMSIASDAFSGGMASALQLREAQEDLFAAHANLLDALYYARVMETELLRLSGILVTELPAEDR